MIARDYVTASERTDCSDRYFLGDILADLGFPKMAKDILKEQNANVIRGYANHAVREATKQHDHSALERLFFMGYL